ncbi:MAG: hypothetical protein BWK73_20040 [Thiothrix lacustris]|uniref:Uncharacterized protein n=1 Tax=Thiothrix lacustris TaxID=525917 RepID=A0A1Y1QP44_9GAMM|nr:MAG: hypothetical protein BWK73_20040 [Thiothrix lacustris]
MAYLKPTKTAKAFSAINNESALARLLNDAIKPHDAVRNAITHALKHGTATPLKIVQDFLITKKDVKHPKWVDGAHVLVEQLLADFESTKNITAVCRKNHIALEQVGQLVEVLIKAPVDVMVQALSDASEIAKALPETAPIPATPKAQKTAKAVTLRLDMTEEEFLAAARAKFASANTAKNPAQLTVI